MLPDDKDIQVELKKIYDLGRNGKVHTENRQRSIRSHIKDVAGIFSTFSYEEFYNYVYQNYMNAVLQGKKLSRSYLLSKINTIKRLSKTRYFGRRDVARIIGNLDKIMNPQAKTSEFYKNTGEKVKLDPKTLERFRNANQARLDKNEDFRQENDLLVSHLYTDTDCELLFDYFSRHLENFLSSGKQPTVDDDLALVVTFMCYSPRRVNEILQLTELQWDELLTKQITTIQSKSNLRPTKLLISMKLAGYLQEYWRVTNENRSPSKCTVIKHSYQQLLRALKRTTANLLKRRVERPFHGFRNYFAGKFRKSDYTNTRRALDHASSRVTNMYASKQRRQYGTEETLDFLNQI